LGGVPLREKQHTYTCYYGVAKVYNNKYKFPPRV
jgi:hypothetical protein